MAIASEIITKFQLFMDDSSDLSTQEGLDLLNSIVQEVASSRVWQVLLKEHTATQSTSVPYIALPSDFAFLTDNNNETDAAFEASRPVIFVNNNAIQVLSYQDRRSHRDETGYAYIDIALDRLVFTKQPSTAGSIEFDYSSVPANLAMSDTLPFPDRFKAVFYHLMCVDDFIIQQSDKAKSYAGENLSRGTKILDQMAYWDAKLIQM